MLQDHFHDSVNVVEHIIIPESQNHETLTTKPVIAMAIVIRLLSMLPAVHFDNQPCFQTYKIDDVVSQRLLASELVTIDLPETKLLP